MRQWKLNCRPSKRAAKLAVAIDLPNYLMGRFNKSRRVSPTADTARVSTSAYMSAEANSLKPVHAITSTGHSLSRVRSDVRFDYSKIVKANNAMQAKDLMLHSSGSINTARVVSRPRVVTKYRQ